MTGWQQGSDVIEELLSTRKVARLVGADAGTHALLERADQQLVSARAVIESDPATAYVVAYDAAKHAGMALLAEQNLRATSEGGHVAIEQALTAQFKGVFSRFGRLRRRRNELEYPAGPDDFADTSEAERALATATDIVQSARQLVEQGVLTTY